jgi:hypothetical protein
MGGALGLALLSTIADAQTRADGAGASALTSGFDLAFGVGAVFTLLGAVVAVLFLGQRSAGATEAEAPQAQTDIEQAEALAA